MEESWGGVPEEGLKSLHESSSLRGRVARGKFRGEESREEGVAGREGGRQ